MRHDLPPRWDGRTVEWRGWTNTPPVMCPRVSYREPCVKCGSTSQPIINRGAVWTTPGETASISRARLEQGRHLAGNLHAFRCPNCRHDTVLDSLTDGNWWDLDEADYTDEGSWSA